VPSRVPSVPVALSHLKRQRCRRPCSSFNLLLTHSRMYSGSGISLKSITHIAPALYTSSGLLERNPLGAILHQTGSNKLWSAQNGDPSVIIYAGGSPSCARLSFCTIAFVPGLTLASLQDLLYQGQVGACCQGVFLVDSTVLERSRNQSSKKKAVVGLPVTCPLCVFRIVCHAGGSWIWLSPSAGLYRNYLRPDV
jgi:hypothetical protein